MEDTATRPSRVRQLPGFSETPALALTIGSSVSSQSRRESHCAKQEATIVSCNSTQGSMKLKIVSLLTKMSAWISCSAFEKVIVACFAYRSSRSVKISRNEIEIAGFSAKESTMILIAMRQSRLLPTSTKHGKDTPK
jgi:hypothetical protein